MVREATLMELPEVFKILGDFHEEARSETPLTFDDETVQKYVCDLFVSKSCILLVGLKTGGVVGCAAATLATNTLDKGQVVANELFLIVKEENRSGSFGPRLEKALRSWAKENKASALIMHPAPWREDVTEMYEKVGYKLLSYMFVRGV